MAKKAATPRKPRNPQDTTLRNTRSASKRLDKLEADVKTLSDTIKIISAKLFRIEHP